MHARKPPPPPPPTTTTTTTKTTTPTTTISEPPCNQQQRNTQAFELVKHAEKQGFKIPKAIASVALLVVRGSVKKRADFDLYDVKPIAKAAESFIPAFFIAAEVGR